MNEIGNRYALTALKNKRAELAGDIKRLKEMVIYRNEQMAHLDATIAVLDPSFDVQTIPPKRHRRVKLFRHGELGRLIREALRKAKGKPLHVSQIVTSILEATGHDEMARAGITPRVRGNLGFLWKVCRTVKKTGTGREARWSLNE